VNYDGLREQIADVHEKTLGGAARSVNRMLLIRNWLIGAWIVELEQRGADRATYGAGLLKRLAKDLRRSGLRDLGPETLAQTRRFYRVYPQLGPAIAATAGRTSLVLPPAMIEAIVGSGPPVPGAVDAITAISETASTESLPASLPALTADNVFHLTWSHCVDLLRIDDPWKRAFYENETLRATYSVRDLQRQIGSLLYERTALSTDKRAVIAAARSGAASAAPPLEHLLRDPYVLEFTGLAERPHYRESDLEAALLDHLQSFLLELGTGFCFEARQKRVTVGTEHDWIDLVFYHRVLRCHLLIDLKVRAFTHGDAGQMNFYLTGGATTWSAKATSPRSASCSAATRTRPRSTTPPPASTPSSSSPATRSPSPLRATCSACSRPTEQCSSSADRTTRLRDVSGSSCRRPGALIGHVGRACSWRQTQVQH
jgi:predicted nuclease of restriction endonuclease-like (RecB) superfamily